MVVLATQERAFLSEISTCVPQAPGDGLCSDRNYSSAFDLESAIECDG